MSAVTANRYRRALSPRGDVPCVDTARGRHSADIRRVSICRTPASSSSSSPFRTSHCEPRSSNGVAIGSSTPSSLYTRALIYRVSSKTAKHACIPVQMRGRDGGTKARGRRVITFHFEHTGISLDVFFFNSFSFPCPDLYTSRTLRR